MCILYKHTYIYYTHFNLLMKTLLIKLMWELKDCSLIVALTVSCLVGPSLWSSLK